MCVVGESVGSNTVGTQYEVYTFGLGFGDDVECKVEFVVFADGVANLAAKSFGESIGHTAAQDEVVDFVHEVFYDTYFGRYLRAAHDGSEGTFDVFQHVVYGFYLFFHEVAQHLVVGIEVVGDDGRRSMFAVCRTESIVYVAVGIRSQVFGKLFL